MADERRDMWDEISRFLMWDTSFGAALLQRRVLAFWRWSLIQRDVLLVLSATDRGGR